VLVVAARSAAALGAFLRFTKVGVAFRAVVNNRAVAGLMGINTGIVSGLAWAMSTAFAAMVGILLSPQLLLDPNLLPPLIIAFVLGAAVVGYLESLPLAWVGGIALGIAQALIITYGSNEPIIGTLSPFKLSDALPFVMITVAVLAAPRALRSGGFGTSFVVRTREVTSNIAASTRTAGGIAFFVALAFVPVITGGSRSWILAFLIGLSQAVVFLSIVILTGFSGQISLGHTAFMGIAVFTGAHLIADLGWPVWVALPAGVLAAAPAGALIGLAAVRLHGLFLALMTLAFAFMAQALFFSDPGISGGEGGIPVPRPPGFTSNTGLFYLVLVALAGAALLATSLRTGRTGRVLAGMRDSETACRSLGIPVTRYKVLIFALSATMAGAGAMLQAMIQEQARNLTYVPFLSLFIVTLAVVGGVFHVGGALTIGVVFGVLPRLLPGISRYQLVLFGLGASLALAQDPEGMFGSLRRGANALAGLLKRRRAPRARAAPVTGGQG
jgi:ABC-type branched-subunit amino acid transport system permease subunit